MENDYFTEGVHFENFNKNIFKKLKINSLYKNLNFPKISNLRKVMLFVLFGICQTYVFAQQVNTELKAYATLDTNVMLIGDKSTLHLSVELHVGEQVVSVKPEMPLDTAHFEIQNPGKWENRSRSPKLERDIKFIAWDSGFYRIDPVIFTLQKASGEKRIIQTLPLLLNVNNPRGIDDLVAPIGIKGIEREALTFEDMMPYIIAGVLIIGIAFLAWFFYKKWKNKSIVPVIQKIVHPPYVIAERLLQELNAKQLWQKDKIKEFYSELSYILRGYLEGQFAMPALESTTDELIDHLKRRQFDEKVIAKTRNLLVTADLVKFAKGKPAMDINDPLWRDAVEIVALTKPKPVVESVDNKGVVKESHSSS